MELSTASEVIICTFYYSDGCQIKKNVENNLWEAGAPLMGKWAQWKADEFNVSLMIWHYGPYRFS